MFAQRSLIFSVALGAALLTACPGGGGSGHVAPDRVVSGQETPLDVDFYVWGHGWGALESRFTELECHYRAGQEGAFHTLAMNVERVTEEKLVARCVLPPFSTADESVEYRFSYQLDKHPNGRAAETVPIIEAR